ncbi:MAG: acetylornithine/succinylornithine family transaminase [Planctomycetes bacterium]|nr:acetylornithine/succinylornithine family transaminase [Planctomycetota bacterium]
MSKQSEIVELTQKHLMPNYARLPVAMECGEGSYIWDADGKKYVDFFAGFGACGVTGHCHPAIVSAIQTQAAKLLCCGNVFTHQIQAELAQAITAKAFGGKVFFCHSGAEANEAALKLARLWAGDGRYKILSFHHAFHGRTMGSLSLTSKKYQKGFEPMLSGNARADFNDLAAVEKGIDAKTAAVIVECIQGEGGMNLATKEFMHGLRKLCDQKNILMIIDEVWTAPARTGKWFAYQLFDIKPDVMTLGKAIGGGAPLAACVAGPKCQDVLQPGTHGCTMGGNSLCAAAGLAVMHLIETDALVMRATIDGLDIMNAIHGGDISYVKSVRGAGMMIGIELDKPGKEIVLKCLEKGLLINCARDFILRLAPPLTIQRPQIEEGINILLDVMKSL